MWMNAKKKLALLLSLVLLLMLLPASVQAEEADSEVAEPPLYLALGDSISFGLTDVNASGVLQGGYVRMFGEQLGKVTLNLSYPGDTSQDLLNLLEGKDHLEEGLNREVALQTSLPNVDIITISIGSNNLLSPFIAGIAGQYDIEQTPEDITGVAMLTQLAGQIYMDYHDGDPTPEMRLAALMDPLADYWKMGAQQFTADWPEIMAQIRYVNPDAQIYVNNLYNPLLASKMTDPAFEPFYELVEKYIAAINSQIYRNSKRFDYKVVHVYQPFNDLENFAYLATPGQNPLLAPLAFNLPMALFTIQSATGLAEINLPAFIMFCDPHPTTAGHQTITQELIKAAKLR
jgi:lysophospholipase L1-like esterase